MSPPAIAPSICLVLLAFLILRPASAQDSIELELSVSTLTSNARSNAPISLEVKLNSWSFGLLDGYLELTCYDGKNLLCRHRSPELVLSAGERISRTILPPMSVRKDLSQLTVMARFVDDSDSHDLGTFLLRVPVHWRRTFILGVVHPDETAFAEIGRDLGDALRIDRLDRGELREIGASSLSSIILPDDLRADGLGLFSFDVLAISGQGFSELLPDQLDAIVEWVEAGGSMAVIVDRTPTGPHAEFLTRISSPDSKNNSESAMSEPRLSMDSQIPTEITFCRPELGRAVILPRLPAQETDIRNVVGFVWKLRSDRLSRFHETGRLDVPDDPHKDANAWDSGNPYLEHRPFRPVRLSALDGLSAILLPESVQGVPLGIILSILLLFLVTIVPGDYLMLGYLKRRRYTWILVPIVSLAFTGFTVWMGNLYLGSTDFRTSLEFIDVGEENRVLRSSRFELLFCATQREVSTELKQVLHTEMPERRVADEDEWDYSTNLRAHGDEIPSQSEVPIYEGNMPTSFTVRKPMRQWSPQLSRQTALRSETEVPPYDFGAIEVKLRNQAGHLREKEAQDRLVKDIHALTPDAQIMLFNGGDLVFLTEGEQSASGSGPLTPTTSKEQQLLGLVRAACVRPSVGLFSVVSQIAPNGAADFEDLTILDPNDPNQWLLAIVYAEGDNFVVVRRLFQGASNGVR